MSATETQAVEIQVEPERAEQPATSPRKRRRRAPTTGAADDCFACQERQVKCDRRRPYCSPCLENGKDCSGYKTTLTWGVGVASRGKLRGLALPIAKSKRAAKSIDEDGNVDNGPKKLAKLGPTRRASDTIDQRTRTSTATSAATTATATTSIGTPTVYNFVNMDANSASSGASPMPPPSFEWRAPQPMIQDRDSEPVRKRQRRHTLQPLQVSSMHPARDYGTMPMTASVVGGYGHHDFGLSSQISPIVPSFSGYGMVSPTYKDYSSQHLVQSPHGTEHFTSHDSLGWTGDNIGTTIDADHTSPDFSQSENLYSGIAPSTSLDHLLPGIEAYSQPGTSMTGPPSTTSLPADSKYFDFTAQPQLVLNDVGDHPSLAVPRAFPSLSIGNTPKLQYLIDYYDKVISPVIVAFDGPTNPYRSHILSLAVESETLQHAIAALSASNLRMRRGHNPLSTNRSCQNAITSSHDHSVRKSSIAHSLMDVGLNRLPETSANEPSQDELYHKGASIKALNEQLADPLRRKDDAILATLLILCLYHICDTGVGKFKTQFAGVKKILALRGGTQGSNSKATNWLTVMFTWFDAMTATVNDREGQLDSDDLDTSKVNGDEWALENLAGCDGRLFKIIAKLGRLNLLSQNKPVANQSPRRSTSPTSKGQSPESKSQDYYSMNYKAFDGNGWSTMIDDAAGEPTNRSQFWQEWSSIRKKLQEWQLDDNTMSPPPDDDRRDLYHISESFRYSALLYTERLGYPHLPSVHPTFQSLVTSALFHITNVKSDVFLLWPLFITGTECVSEQGRYLIRERCLDIQKDSGFFNNISGLELLEKIWRDDAESIDQQQTSSSLALPAATSPIHNDFPTMGGHGFKWRKAMERVDGEYIVV